jgi:hypothetical protein
MKNKLISLSIVFSIIASILCAPAYIFIQDFCSDNSVFRHIGIKGFSKNIVLSESKTAKLNDFTDNIKAKQYKNADFTDNLALLQNTKLGFVLERSQNNASQLNTIDSFAAYNFFILDRLRTCGGNNSIPIFIFFILLYIGMLKAVYLNKNISLLNIKKPLFE